jgi:hypothetical protein
MVPSALELRHEPSRAVDLPHLHGLEDVDGQVPRVSRRGEFVPYLLFVNAPSPREEHGDHGDEHEADAEELWAVIIVPRFLVSLGGEEEYLLGTAIRQDTRAFVPDGLPRTWRNALTGEVVHAWDGLGIGDLLQSFPVALLANQE